MILIRSSFYFLMMVISIIIFGVFASTLGWLLPIHQRDKLATQWGRLNLWLLKVICNLDYKITGIENLPESSAIIMSKHQSTWETISLRGLLPPAQTWVLKQELMRIPIFGWALATVSPIAIDRKAGKKAAKQIIEQGSQRLKEGRFVIIFPEGTRTAPGEKKKYGIGGGLLAEKSGYPVIPIAHNAGSFWRRRGINKYPGTIEVVIGPALDTKDKKASHITRDVQEWIENEMEKLSVEQ